MAKGRSISKISKELEKLVADMKEKATVNNAKKCCGLAGV